MGARPSGGDGPRVLVVDDDFEQLELSARLLGDLCEVIAVGSPSEALERLKGESFDVILSDQCMPEMFGTELLAEARRLQPGSRRVVMSAFAEPAELLPAIDAGNVHRFVSKPVRPEELFEGYERGDQEIQCLILGADEEQTRQAADTVAQEPSFQVKRARQVNGAAADLVLLVAPEPVRSTEETISMLRLRSRQTAVMAALSPEAVSDSASLLAAGIDDILWLPIRGEEVRLRFETWRSRRRASHEAARVRSAGAASGTLPEVIGESEAMRRVFHQVHRVASSDASVLLNGETGTGKEVLARAVHALSPRRDAPFLAVNLSAVPESLVESELFGHEKGAFTGARSPREGRLEAVAGGTLFLDEVGDLSPNVQVKLLRVLEQRTFERIGSTKQRAADFRLVCATHRDLEALIAEGSFREDLYYRINVVHIEVPPLRERGEDVRLLAEHFLSKYRRKYGIEAGELTERAIRALVENDWPGNVRQLQHVIERAVAMNRGGQRIDEEQLWNRAPRTSFRQKTEGGLEDGRGLREILADIERTMLVETLERFNGNRVAAAKKLKIPRQTLQNRLKKYGL